MILAMCLPPHAARPTARPAHVTLPSRSLGAQVVKHSRLLSSSSTAFLQQKLQLRAPYVAPLNILQAREAKGIRPVPLFVCLVCSNPSHGRSAFAKHAASLHCVPSSPP